MLSQQMVLFGKYNSNYLQCFYRYTGVTNNASSANIIAYCFAEKKGFSKFGSYTGNGNADGTFVYTGFKPAFVMIKNLPHLDEGWHMFDNKRSHLQTEYGR
jgi:hypothetical protein